MYSFFPFFYTGANSPKDFTKYMELLRKTFGCETMNNYIIIWSLSLLEKKEHDNWDWHTAQRWEREQVNERQTDKDGMDKHYFTRVVE